MSWDIVLFNSEQKITVVEDLDEQKLVPTDFCTVFENHFEQILKNDNHREIRGNDFIIDYYIDGGRVSNKVISLYGENGLYELVILAKQHNWQIFDTALEQMIDLENPSNNGFENFQNYLLLIKKG